MLNSPTRPAVKSAAHIVIRPRSSPAETSPVDPKTRFFRDLRELMAACGSDKNDQVIALITACIQEGIDTRPQIVGVAEHLGFNKRHAAIQLKYANGTNPDRHRWTRDENGTYRLLT